MKPVRLTEESIRGYGQLISAASKDLTYNEPDFKYIADIGNLVIEGNITTGILIGKKRERVLEKFERHLRTPELLIALEHDAIVPMAKPCESVKDIEEIRLFYVRQGDAFVMDRGTWHWVPFPVDAEECKMLVLFRENTSIEDGGVVEFSSPIYLSTDEQP